MAAVPLAIMALRSELNISVWSVKISTCVTILRTGPAAHFDDHDWPLAWQNPHQMIADNEVLVPYRSENTERVEVHDRNKRVVTFSDQNYLLDLGKEIIGGLKVNLFSAFDQRVTVMMGEQLNDDGHVRHEMACGPDYIENWTLVKDRINSPLYK